MIKAIVTDIEGTTSSLSFVKDVLFPYARAKLPEFVKAHAEDLQVAPLLAVVSAEVGKELDLDATIAQLIDWIDQDKKITPLKALQGLIWDQGYQQSDFKGHVYDDAVENLKRWHEQGLALYIYSSGSVHAQKLLFAHTDHGDLTPLFSGYFDTNIGAKREVTAYYRIAEEIGLSASELLFLSDIKEELDAAKAAGFGTVWLVRDGELSADAEHPQVAGFDGIIL